MKSIGLIAGSGRFPFLVADEIKKSGNQVVCVALKEEANPELESHCDKYFVVSVGKFQKIVNCLKDEGVDTAIMAGRVQHVKIYSAISMDFRAIKVMGSLINKKTDTILKTIVDEFNKDGIQILPSHLYLKNLMPQKGLVAGKKLSKDEQKDVEFGFKIAKGIAGLDIGQTVVVKDKSVLAVESVEGTDECIRRAFKLGGKNSIVVKVAKPNQDFRFDVPVIGTNTIKVLDENKVRAMAIEAGCTLILDRTEVEKMAKDFGVTIIAV